MNEEDRISINYLRTLSEKPKMKGLTFQKLASWHLRENQSFGRNRLKLAKESIFSKNPGGTQESGLTTITEHGASWMTFSVTLP